MTPNNGIGQTRKPSRPSYEIRLEALIDIEFSVHVVAELTNSALRSRQYEVKSSLPVQQLHGVLLNYLAEQKNQREKSHYMLENFGNLFFRRGFYLACLNILALQCKRHVLYSINIRKHRKIRNMKIICACL